MSDLYGQLESEKVAEENLICRHIVQEINNFGINQRQLKYVIYLLSMNIENAETMQEMVSAIKEICPDIFLAKESS